MYIGTFSTLTLFDNQNISELGFGVKIKWKNKTYYVVLDTTYEIAGNGIL